MSSQVQNSSKINDDSNDEIRGKMSNWHQNNMSIAAQKSALSAYPSGSTSTVQNSDGINDTNDANKANFSAMTKKRKAMHQANSNRNSADENVNK